MFSVTKKEINGGGRENEEGQEGKEQEVRKEGGGGGGEDEGRGGGGGGGGEEAWVWVENTHLLLLRVDTDLLTVKTVWRFLISLSYDPVHISWEHLCSAPSPVRHCLPAPPCLLLLYSQQPGN